MNFSRTLILLLVFGLAANGCRRAMPEEELAARQKVRRALQEHAFTRAIPLARRILEYSPNDNGAWARLAQAQWGARDLSGLRQTLAEWRRAVKRISSKYHEYRGDLARAEQRPDEALAAWNQAVAGNERKARVFRKIARLQQAKGNWQEAALAWTRAMTPNETVEGLVNRARCYRQLHSWKPVSADLHRAIELFSGNEVARQELARFDQLGKFLEEVRELDKQCKALPNDPDLPADQALLFLRAGDAPLALDASRQAAEIAPSAVRPKIFRALALRALGKKEKSPVHESLRLESLTPEFLQTIRRLDAELLVEPGNAELLINRAWQLNEIGQPRLALADAKSALKINPKSPGALAEESYAEAKLGQEAQAYAQIKRATELDSNFSTAWLYRGELEMRRQDYLLAIDSFTHALAINQTPAALAKREECYRRLGLLAKAEDDRKALKEIDADR